MKGQKCWIGFLMLGLAATLAVWPVEGQKGASRGMRSGMGQGMPYYDPATETTVKGTVEEVKQHEMMMGWMGTHLALKSGNETFDVHLGPSGFLQDEGVSFARGDEIEVIGSKVKMGETNALLARQIKQRDKTLTLRDEQGRPLWSQSGPRSGQRQRKGQY